MLDRHGTHLSIGDQIVFECVNFGYDLYIGTYLGVAMDSHDIARALVSYDHNGFAYLISPSYIAKKVT